MQEVGLQGIFSREKDRFRGVHTTGRRNILGAGEALKKDLIKFHYVTRAFKSHSMYGF